MKALVTGSTGFIGSSLVERLIRNGYQVRALTRKTSSLTHLGKLDFEKVEGDLAHFDSLKKAVEGVDLVFHLAGATQARDRAGYFRQNAEGTANLARAVAENAPGLKRFVYVSSLAAAGPSSRLEHPTESDRVSPVSWYGESKLQGEIELLKYKDQIPSTIIRPPIVYGPKDKNVFLFMQTVSKNIMPVLKGSGPDGRKYYSIVHVDDLVQGISLAGEKLELPSGEVFFISGDETVSYEELMSSIAEALQKKPIKIPVPSWIMFSAAQGLSVLGQITGKSFPLNGDKWNELKPDFWICSNEKAKRLLNFESKVKLKDGLAQTVQWYRENSWLE